MHLTKLLIIFFVFTSFLSFAQKKEIRDTKVDSLAFINNRKVLNNLNTEIFQKRTFKNATVEIPYRLLTPNNSDKTKKFPLVITFHNSTRIGNDNENQLEPLAKIWLRDEIYSKYQCYVLAPQFSKRSSNYENNADNIQISKPSNEVVEIFELIKKLQKEYQNIDMQRIYLIGYSMGASTAQNLLNLKPNKFAAMVSVAAVPDFSNFKKYKNKNIWLIHGEQDNENPYAGSVALYNKLALNTNLTFTTYTNLNHNNIITPFLTTEEIPKWLFEKYK